MKTTRIVGFKHSIGLMSVSTFVYNVEDGCLRETSLGG